MVRPQLVLMLCMATLAVGNVGCSTFGGRSVFSRDKQWEPDAGEEDKWADVGKEARGNRRVEKNRDPIDKLLWSDEAQQINRSLGVE
ncbi:hypothetical protein [Planctellipticum variicoloris]|uniref:hypothetical protein n=1 Tax=Planctellipticum variicoloris TaxID=3064265 RepID=UPI0030141114|nr:hypothetical protein SH412_000637 [Planctomycetaceae bacterium SH412]